MAERRSRKPIDYSAFNLDDDEDDFQDSGSSSSSQERAKAKKNKEKKKKQKTTTDERAEQKETSNMTLKEIDLNLEAEAALSSPNRRSLPRKSLDEKRFDLELEMALAMSKDQSGGKDADDVEALLNDDKEIPMSLTEVSQGSCIIVENDDEPARVATPPAEAAHREDAMATMKDDDKDSKVEKRNKEGEEEVEASKVRPRGRKRRRTGNVVHSDEESGERPAKEAVIENCNAKRKTKNKMTGRNKDVETDSELSELDDDDDDDKHDDDDFSDDSDFGSRKKTKSKNAKKSKSKKETKNATKNVKHSSLKNKTAVSPTPLATSTQKVIAPSSNKTLINDSKVASNPPNVTAIQSPNPPSTPVQRKKSLLSKKSPLSTMSSPVTPRTPNSRLKPLAPSPGGSSVALPPGKCNIPSPASIKHGLSRNARIKPLLSCIKRQSLD